MFHHPLKFLLILLFLSVGQGLRAESGPGNGTDYVKVLFAEAQSKLNQLMQPVSIEQARDFELDPDCQKWLFQEENSQSHWEELKLYLSKIRLAFQKEACGDSQGRKSSICFYHDNPQDPYVVISMDENKNTTSEQAMAMLVHEAGHFVGEMDHLFLDRVGVQVVRALLDPKSFSVTVSSTEMTTNVFLSKEDCESGQSSQARTLLSEAQIKLAELCQLHRKTCDLQKALLSYRGQIEQKPGIGFTMNVTCELKALLPL